MAIGINYVKRRKWYIRIFYLLIIAILIYGLFHFGYIKKNCKQDPECFYRAAKECKPAKVLITKNGHYYDYVIQGKRGSSCSVYISLKKMASGSSVDQKALFEGKDMTCKIPLSELDRTSFSDLKGFVNYCHGTLKEAIYEQIITKMYGLIIQNMDEIISSATQVIS
ncbi:hypothetical protein FJZ53_03355 [Candidatus Woesearchaeota archaeon]|nr:hypothetical protein [Candidatus Woesearchaeota archaeon]